MDRELKRYYDARFSMMETEGWSDLIEDVTRMYNATNSIDGVDSEKALYIRKGETSMMRWILSLNENSRIAYDQLRREDETAS